MSKKNELINPIYGEINTAIREMGYNIFIGHSIAIKDKKYNVSQLYFLQYTRELFSRIIKISLDISLINRGKYRFDVDFKMLMSNVSKIKGYEYVVEQNLEDEEFDTDFETQYIKLIDAYDALVHGYSHPYEHQNKELFNRIYLLEDETLRDKLVNEEYIKKRKNDREKLDDIYKKIIEENKPEDIYHNAVKEDLLILRGIPPDEAREKIYTTTYDDLIAMGYEDELNSAGIFKLNEKITKEPQLTPISSTSSYMTADEEPFYDASSEFTGGKRHNKNKKSNKHRKSKRNSRKRRKTQKYIKKNLIKRK